jgi:RNA 2',3'-cyclic 3'-phosphodiesterase
VTLALRPDNRLFVALDLPAGERERLGAEAEALARDLGGRAVAAGRLHVTLSFLGRVPPDRGPALAGALRRACTGVPGPLALRPGALAGRPAGGRARLLARELAGSEDALAALYRDLGADLAAALGRPADEGRLWPHVTLVRFRRPVRATPAIRADRGAGGGERAFVVSRAALYDSVQIPGRPPRYDGLASAALGASTP